MKKVFEDIIASNDMQAIKNCVTVRQIVVKSE